MYLERENTQYMQNEIKQSGCYKSCAGRSDWFLKSLHEINLSHPIKTDNWLISEFSI